ncbi:hypothetical protein Hanom_Chr16g01508711 [Helianthus anomalus]
MELIQRPYKASKFAPQDFFSNMPDNVVTNILDRLPLQHAVRMIRTDLLVPDPFASSRLHFVCWTKRLVKTLSFFIFV